MCFLPRDDILKQLKFAQEKVDGKLRMDLEQTKKFKVNDLDLLTLCPNNNLEAVARKKNV